MSFLTGWIANILLFILLAIVIDMLLPNSSMQKYAKMVIGLILIVIILNPVFQLFSVDINQLVRQFQLSSGSGDDETKKMIESQKKEIQASQRAYILEQMAVQMKKDAGEELLNRYQLEIRDLDVQIPDERQTIKTSNDIQSVQVVLTPAYPEEEKGEEAIEAIEPIRIDAAQETPSAGNGDTADIRERGLAMLLAQKWDLDQAQILITVEGGEDSGS
ncbi:stage III sporulation protein AF [Bacillus mangrovi]|uniref:Stage III sporulation protein AF n=1 Tax=Metabacillus mangrovi TaxID=1491830 RepID=A0A7X2S285_9BACI|nr:stage III sporulation protein AF [Metabacillus mangrovi]MTH52359.1 stage III sporulation protein AF [Metabacillus mangrovi]